MPENPSVPDNAETPEPETPTSRQAPVFQTARHRILAQFAIRDRFVEAFVDRKLEALFRPGMSVEDLLAAYYRR
ncbi:MAG: hypothetical protein P4M00_08480 [Azospirillaceae bacterium]|nr:hypothetical protein [Azospirillaceae bacterium]